MDATVPADLAALRERLTGVQLDLLLVNAGVTGDDEPVGAVAAEEFARVMVTNALGPMLAIEVLAPQLTPNGTIAMMSSRRAASR